MARLDGRPGAEEYWFRNNLQGQFNGEIDAEEMSPQISGVVGSPYAGLELQLNGEASAADQISPDQMVPRKDSLTRPVLQYASGDAAGLEAGYCEPYRIIQLGFGVEAVDGAETRTAVIERSIEALLAPRVPLGVRWLPEQQQEIMLPGEKYLYELNVQNMSEIITDTFELQVKTYQWASSLVTKTLELGPCAVGKTLLTERIAVASVTSSNSGWSRSPRVFASACNRS